MYSSLQKAINAAASGDTVTVLENITLAEPVTVAADDKIVLDLNGKTVTGKPTESAAYAVIINKGDLTIQDSGSNGKIVCNHTLEGSTSYAVNTILNAGTLTVEGGSIENTSTASNQIGYAIDNNSTSANAVLTVSGGSISATGSNYYDAIRQFCNSTTMENSVTVSGGSVSSIWMQNPSDGSVKNTKDVKGSVTVRGGNVLGLYVEPSLAFAAEVSGGTIGTLDYFQTAEGRDLTGFVTGGTFTNKPDDAFAAEGYQFKKNDNGTYSVVEKTYVAEVGGEKFYDLQAAIDAAGEGDTVVILDSFTMDYSVTVAAGDKLTLDLNGKTVTGLDEAASASFNLIVNKGDLTINDTVGGGKITLAASNAAS